MRLLQLKKYLRWFQSNLEYTSIALENTQKNKILKIEHLVKQWLLKVSKIIQFPCDSEFVYIQSLSLHFTKLIKVII